MKYFRFCKNLTQIALGKLCRQRMLLAGLALLCFLLPLLLGPVASSLLSQGVAFNQITLAIVAPEEDSIGAQLTQILSGMQDIRKYCQVQAMTQPEAEAALARGDITAALIIPEGFVSGILNGTNPDVTLMVSPDRPLESLLLLWLGQNAADLLATVQSSIYTVLEQHAQNPAQLEYRDVLTQINLTYISWTLNRQDMYRIQEIPVTNHLPISTHYVLSLFAYLALSLAPVFFSIYTSDWVRSLSRFRTAGIGACVCFSASVTACSLVQAVLTFFFLLFLPSSNVLIAIPISILFGLFCALFGSLCCLLATDTGSCSSLSFGGSLLLLFLSGGILPPVLMPGRLQPLIPFSPVTWLRNIMAAAVGYECPLISLLGLVCSGLIFFAAGCLLYARRSRKGGVSS